MINKHIENYRINKFIGAGGMAKVYEAVENETLQTKVAIKILNPDLAKDKSLKTRFEKEAKILANLKHHNIVTVRNLIETPEHLAIIMELLEGEDISSFIKKNGAFSEPKIELIFPKILNAFSYAHANHIVHRDVKPSNIFLQKNDLNPKILDFGIAKIVDPDRSITATLTSMGSIGTPLYMSPEQIKAPLTIDHRSDIYSLGVTLYFMLLGKLPYDPNKSSQWEIQTQIINDPLPLLPMISKKMNNIIQKATAKDKSKRYQTCEEFKQAFNENKQFPPKFDVRKEIGKINNLFTSFSITWWITVALTTISIILFATETEENVALIFVFIAIILFTVANILKFILLFKAWKSLQGTGYERTTPENAIGLLFVPFYNLYWVFIAYRGLCVNINKYMKSINIPQTKLTSTTYATFVCVINVIPYVQVLNLFFIPFLMANIKKATITILVNKS